MLNTRVQEIRYDDVDDVDDYDYYYYYYYYDDDDDELISWNEWPKKVL